ncbi:hypothetical protein Hanom_Chr01g00062381 [Helianthus anomalus]
MPKIKISNITKKTRIYSHYYVQHWIRISGDEEKCFSWLSHWMFGPNEMKAGDNIIIECNYVLDSKMECGLVLRMMMVVWKKKKKKMC